MYSVQNLNSVNADQLNKYKTPIYLEQSNYIVTTDTIDSVSLVELERSYILTGSDEIYNEWEDTIARIKYSILTICNERFGASCNAVNYTLYVIKNRVMVTFIPYDNNGYRIYRTVKHLGLFVQLTSPELLGEYVCLGYYRHLLYTTTRLGLNPEDIVIREQMAYISRKYDWELVIDNMLVANTLKKLETIENAIEENVLEENVLQVVTERPIPMLEEYKPIPAFIFPERKRVPVRVNNG